MALTRKIEQISFKDENGVYLDVNVCDDYVEISINESKEKISLTLEDWKSIDKEIRRIFKDMKNGEKQ
jgi:hypothetical protein